MSGKDNLKRHLMRYKDLLANLSRQNRELYFKEIKGSSLNLTKQQFSNSSFKDGASPKFEAFSFSSPQLTTFLDGSEYNLHSHFQLEDIESEDEVIKLNRKIDRIRLADDKFQREFGISGAWLLGPFLCWRSSAQAEIDDLIVTPLFKVPINIKKNKKKNLCLIAEEEELKFNPSLCLALKQCYGVSLEETKFFKTSDEAITYLREELKKCDRELVDAAAEVRAIPKRPAKYKNVKSEDGESVERIPVDFESELSAEELTIYKSVTASKFLLIDAAYVDQLNASRAVLIGDYDGIINSECEHPILSELFNGAVISEQNLSARDDLKRLDGYKERNNHFVVDIDSTQHRAIDKALNSRSVVIQGPPGTGKSQTIVNLIANYLSKGKRVLFVAEKRPALDVVYNRMKTAGIDSQAVLLHGSSLNKTELYKTFLQLANTAPNASDEILWTNVSDSLDRVKKELNTYASEISKVHSPSLEYAADAIVQASRVDSSLFDPVIASKFGALSRAELETLKNEVSSLQSLMQALPNFSSSPWLYRKPTTIRTTSLEHQLQGLKASLFECRKVESELLHRFKILTGRDADLHLVNSIADVPRSTKLPVEYSSLWDQHRIQIENSLTTLCELLKDSVKKLESRHRQFEAIKVTSKDLMPDSRVEALLEYYSQARGITDWFSAAFWSNKKTRNEICPNWDGTTQQFAGYVAYIETLRELEKLSKTFHSSLVIDGVKHADLLIRIQSEISGLLHLTDFMRSAELNLPEKLKNSVNSSLGEFNQALLDIDEVQAIWQQLQTLRTESESLFNQLESLLLNVPQTTSAEERLNIASDLLETVNHLEFIDRFDVHLIRVEDSLKQEGLKATLLERLAPSPASWAEVIDASVSHKWKDEILSQSPSLRAFDRKRQTDVNMEFNKLAIAHKSTAKQAVLNSFAKRWNDPLIANRKGLPLLNKEAGKSRMVLSPREIMEKGAIDTMMQLKPCWLMSPLSISQMLPLVESLFDVIIFDEASQVKVEDAIPSIYRAKTMIVVGDDKQMPPTAFFSGSSTDEDADEEVEEIAPSVLDLALQIYPAELLEWHYRSRSEALIAFSNRAFYEGRLIAVPNPNVLTSGKPIEHRFVKNAYFTSKSGNMTEADAVIDYLIQMIKENPKRSYGVIAMGMSQAKALSEVYEARKDQDPKLKVMLEAAENFLDNDADAGLFIKNLENVQGDERDVVLMSVGYAPAGEGKKLRIGFGPLSSKGGGRRLNVAVTRAKSKMIVFTSFEPSQIPSDEETFARNPDLCFFGRYLQYAEAVSSDQVDKAKSILKSFPMPGVVTSRASSRFALDVKRRLEENGHSVSAEIGSSGFYIDLAIYHPSSKTQFMLGIECDGAIFHSTPYARDRDKIRQELLESRGWKIERIWSQDWSADWRSEILRIETALELICGVKQSEEKAAV